MIRHPTPEQIAACHALGESLLRFLLLSRPEPAGPEKGPQPPRPTWEGGRASQPGAPGDPNKGTQAGGQLLFGLREAAAMLSISDRTLWALTTPRGPIPSVRIGRAVRYLVDDLREWAKQARK